MLQNHSYRFSVTIVFLLLTALAAGDLIEIIPFFAPLVASPLFPFFHQTHDLLALIVALYAAHKLNPAAGFWAVAWFVALHLPYAVTVLENELPELLRLAVLVGTALFGVHIIAARHRLETQLNESAVDLEAQRAAERQRADELDALRVTANEILTEGELPHLFQIILARAVTLLDATGGDLGLYDAARNEIRIVASHQMGKDFTGTRMQLGEGAMRRVAETREPLIVPDYQKWEGRSPQYAQGAWHAVMAAPLLASGRLVGAIGIVDANPEHRFTASDLRLLNLFAQHAALALERGRLFQIEQHRREAAVALLEITQVASSSLELKQVLKHIARRTAEACRANRCTILLLDEAGEFLQPVMSQFADGHADLEQWNAFKSATAERMDVVPLFRDAIRERRPALLAAAARTDLVPARWTQPFGIQKLLVVPLVSLDRAIGLMALDHAETIHEFTPEQIDLALTIGGQVTSAITNARLYAKAERRADQLRALREASRALTSDLRLEVVLQTLTEAARRLANARYAALAVLGADGNLAQFHTTLTEAEQQRIGVPPQGRGLLGALLRDGVPIRVPDLARDPRAVGFPPHHPVMKTFMGVPIVARGKVLGGLYLTDKADDQPFSQVDEDLVVGLAADAAIAIENARLFGQVQQLAITDGLTGLHNRRALDERLQVELLRAQRYHHPLSVIMADIDHFKNYNDTHGHPEGDVILWQVADLLRAQVRETDFVARYGGEEFVALLPETAKAAGMEVAEKIRAAVEATRFPRAETQPGGKLTISLGVATFPEDLAEAHNLISKADEALYRAKRAGRDRVCGA